MQSPEAVSRSELTRQINARSGASESYTVEERDAFSCVHSILDQAMKDCRVQFGKDLSDDGILDALAELMARASKGAE